MLILTSAAKVVALYFTLMIMEENNAKAASRIPPAGENLMNNENVGKEEMSERARGTVMGSSELKTGDSVSTFQQKELKIEEGNEDKRPLTKRVDSENTYQTGRRISFQPSFSVLDDKPLARRPRSLQATPNERLPVRRIRSLQSSYFEDESDDDDPLYGPLPVLSPGPGYQKLSTPISGLVSPFHMKPPGAPAAGGGRAFMSEIKKMGPALNLEDESIMDEINYKR